MKISVFVNVLCVGFMSSTALAGITTDTAPDGTLISVTYTPDDPAPPAARLGRRLIPSAVADDKVERRLIATAVPEDGLDKRNQCNHDNCLRALLGRSSAASPFCSTFTETTNTGTTGFGPFQTQCANNATRVSSACSCAVPAPTAPPCGGQGAPCTLSDFIQACCGLPNGVKGCEFPNGDPNQGFCIF